MNSQFVKTQINSHMFVGSVEKPREIFLLETSDEREKPHWELRNAVEIYGSFPRISKPDTVNPAPPPSSLLDLTRYGGESHTALLLLFIAGRRPQQRDSI